MSWITPFMPLSAGISRIRHFGEGELTWLYALECDPEVKQFVDRGPYVGDKAEWLEKAGVWVRDGVLDNPYALAVVTEDGELEGTCGLFQSRVNLVPTGEFDLRIVLRKRKANTPGQRGIAIARVFADLAFTSGGARTIVGQVDSRNERAIVLVKKMGFRFASSEPKEDSAQNLRYELSREQWKASTTATGTLD